MARKPRYKFSYKKIGNYYRPIIDIKLKHEGKEVNYAVLLDSGSDFNIFHSDVAKLLGIDISGLKPFSFGGVKKGVSCVGYSAGVEIEVNGITFKAAVLFTSDFSDNGYAIVGQRGFFEHFTVIFDYANREGIIVKK
ncbi:MAG TPA: hypothetical protein VNW29_02960 [Candidatus Sulfotelmatobacter sp.]|jgi:hypothetical protein|nr:hypothetical protein [Candidatus Sulfotelmatobacter sp.]